MVPTLLQTWRRASLLVTDALKAMYGRLVAESREINLEVATTAHLRKGLGESSNYQTD
jgi:hypothetical protein